MGLDRLELFDIAYQHNLGAAGLGIEDHTLHLPRADHLGVNHEHIAIGEKLAVLRLLMLESGDQAMPEPTSRFLAAMPDTNASAGGAPSGGG